VIYIVIAMAAALYAKWLLYGCI